MGTVELQNEIKHILAKLKWSQKRLGREFYIAKHDYDDDDEIRQYEEKVKKDLMRKTTKPELLNSYLEVISQHNEFQSLNIVIPSYCKSGILSDEMELGMSNISKLISKIVPE
ncbi:hypothetical protein ACTXIM_15970 [Pseudoalteromonas nigrifaciens]|uniref:hypothetical protein n=1 Tax=Pseudoalteromonas nigrifaciens TaxID=28109 RepID=UPI0017888ACF|nr:hypothetical protein [Pseudoalteromonas nigrifaciens]MBE0420202.1 hypothetical protein [Pseudoalteromonas nigrifaciens]